MRFPQNDQHLNTRQATGPHGRPGSRSRSGLLSGRRLAGVLIVLGDWDQAGRLTGLLPAADSRVRLLRSEFAFVRGDFEGAQAEAEMALMGSSAERIHVLIRLADIALYLGDFSQAQRYGHAALDLDSASDASLRARCYGIVAATEYFGGDIEAAGTRFREALELLESTSGADRDRVLHATILANLGTVAETRHDWAAAERYHREALRLRREVADSRSRGRCGPARACRRVSPHEPARGDVSG